MTDGRVLRQAELPVLLSGSRSPVWWAMILLVVIESTVFATLITSYLYLRFGSAQWPPEGMPVADLLLPTINTGVLIASAGAMYWATRQLRKGDVRKLKIWMGVAVGLEIVFLVIKLVAAGGLGFKWYEHAYGSIHWMISWLHSAHVIAAILLGAVAWLLALKGFFDRERIAGMQVVSIYWNFVAVVWMPVYGVLYLVPRWF